jgi:predicted RND superfamily exporter protein
MSLLAIVWVFAAMAATDHSLSILTGLLAPMLLAIGSVYGVHAIARYQEEAAVRSDVPVVVEAALRQLVVPVLISGATTNAAFAALLISDVPAVRELGWFSMLGISSITLLTLTAVPAILVQLPLRKGERGESIMQPAFAGLSSFVARRSWAIIGVATLLGLLSAAAIPRIVIDTDYLSYFDQNDPVRRDFEAINRLLAGAIPIYVVLDAGESGAFRDPELLAVVEGLQRRLDRVPGVSHTLSTLDTLRQLNRAFAAGDPSEERIPDTRGAVSELLFMLPKGDSNKFMTIDHRRANVIVRTGLVGSLAITELAAELEAVTGAQPWPEGLDWSVTGNTILLARSADGIARSQPLSVCLAAVAIFLLVALGLQSLGLGAIAMVPNLLPVLLFFGLLGAGVAPLSLPTSLIGCVALGVAIDDSVHFLVRYRNERLAGADPNRAAATAGQRVGRPIALTSLVISLGFLVVVFSEFSTLREFGLLSAATMVICLATDLILLPALLIRARV